MACSCVAMLSQSKAYAASSATTTATKIVFANLISNKLVIRSGCVKASDWIRKPLSEHVIRRMANLALRYRADWNCLGLACRSRIL